MAVGNLEGYSPKQISATTTVKTGDGVLGNIFVSAASSTPTITVYDGTSTAGTKIVDTFTPVSATNYRLPAGFAVGLHVVISGTVSCTVLYV